MNAAEADLRSEIALAILAFLSWAEMYRGGCRVVLEGAIASWLTVGRPADPGISKAIEKLRSMLTRHVGSGGRVPAWVPASLLEIIEAPERNDNEQ